MCTCINVIANNTYFGRNLDLDYSFNEKIIITPRNYLINFKKSDPIINHYALIGIGTVINNYPLYADAINEKGLAFAGLNFPQNCKYQKFSKNKINIAPFELPLYILSQCKNVKEAISLLKNMNIINIPFSKEVALTPLHFMISDKKNSIVVESINNEFMIYKNEFNILTNNPPFPFHKNNIANYMQLHNGFAFNNINENIDIQNYSFGQGAIGLPGDFSSSSRFIKVFFIKNFMKLTNNNENNINQFFKCLDSVSMIRGCVKTHLGYEYTRYTSCYNLNQSILYYKTYDNNLIKKIQLNKYKIDEKSLIIINL